MRTSVVIGSRGSRLALIQAESVASRLRELHPQLDVSIRKIVTEGDRNRNIPLEKVSDVGMFVKKLEEALVDREIDIAVHSCKDVPTDTPPGLSLLAAIERLDPRDVLVARTRLADLPAGARIGTGSLRRSVQLARYRRDLEVCSIRGNVDTRVRKVASGEVDGVILAAAALRRLDWENRITEYLPVEHFLPAVGQGALVLEGRADDPGIAAVVALVNHLPTWQSVIAERAFLKALGGGCRAPIAALGTVSDNTLILEGMASDPLGGYFLRSSEEGDAAFPEALGNQLADKLLSMGASEFIAGARLR